MTKYNHFKTCFIWNENGLLFNDWRIWAQVISLLSSLHSIILSSRNYYRFTTIHALGLESGRPAARANFIFPGHKSFSKCLKFPFATQFRIAGSGCVLNGCTYIAKGKIIGQERTIY